MEGLTEAQLKECYVKPGKGTKGYCFHEIMLQTKKPKEALRFYSEALGMRWDGLNYIDEKYDLSDHLLTYISLAFKRVIKAINFHTFKEKRILNTRKDF